MSKRARFSNTENVRSGFERGCVVIEDRRAHRDLGSSPNTRHVDCSARATMRTAFVVGVSFVVAVACSPPRVLESDRTQAIGSGSDVFDAGAGSGEPDAEEPDCFDPDVCLDQYYDGTDSDETEYTTPVPPDDESVDAGVGGDASCGSGCGSGSDAGVSDGGVDDAPADAGGCTGQAEPACPMPPP